MHGIDSPGPPIPQAMVAAEAGIPLRVAIVGAESTGKSVLAHALADALAREFGLRCAVVDEWLRAWCEREGRTPRADEQMGIAREHARLIDEAAARPGLDLVLCDTTPLMVAVYSELLFGDRDLEPVARDCQERMDLTLLTALDLPWVADGIMRDGPHVREPVDRGVRARLLRSNAAWAVVAGDGAARTAHAFDALRPLLERRCARHAVSGGLFSSLLDGGAGPPRPPLAPCLRCDPPPVGQI